MESVRFRQQLLGTQDFHPDAVHHPRIARRNKLCHNIARRMQSPRIQGDSSGTSLGQQGGVLCESRSVMGAQDHDCRGDGVHPRGTGGRRPGCDPCDRLGKIGTCDTHVTHTGMKGSRSIASRCKRTTVGLETDAHYTLRDSGADQRR